MRFVKVDSPLPAATIIAQAISAHLNQHRTVLWLVSGGSAIDVAVTARKQLTGNLNHLTVMLMDERYGPPGHPESNWQKLLDAGFDMNGLHSYPTLTGKDMDKTTQDFSEAFSQAVQQASFTIGLFGIGPDGHTAGILPESPAVSSQKIVAAYNGPDFQRITIAPAAFTEIDEALVYAMGEQKRAALEDLHTEKPISEQPAQLLKRIPSVTIFNNLMEDEI